ncbi:tyrosine-type recombinase/integrase [Mesorhizobium sp. M0522]|uniref:tyrosine-type recombinase/integrase n=1 Tax=Mesorhizobium sp. M0522 TaxID=2956958 RepID=UPI00333A3ACF
MSIQFSVPKAKDGLTVKSIAGFKPRPDGGFYEVSDIGETKALHVRVSARAKVFYMNARWKKGATSATSRAIGEFSEIDRAGFVTLAQARDKAREWEALRRAGIDPAKQAAEEKEAQERAKAKAEADAVTAQAGVFSAVVEAYLADAEFRKQRRLTASEREIRTELLDPERNAWMSKLMPEVEDEDVFALVAAIRDRKRTYSSGREKLGAPYQAINVFDHVKRIYAWAMNPERRKKFGLRYNPIVHLQKKDFKLKKHPRQRVLTPDEIRAFWLATKELGYPYGPMYRLLLVTGQRLNEIAQASWPEFDLRESVLVVPSERFKSKAIHRVALSDLALEILATVPRFEKGSFLFSLKNGRIPARAFGTTKKKLDELMLVELKKIAAERGDPEPASLTPFVNHDLRRSVRTQLAALKVPSLVAEMVIGHDVKGLERVYNQYEFEKEKREALQLWADRLRLIVDPPAAPNVVPMRRAS